MTFTNLQVNEAVDQLKSHYNSDLQYIEYFDKYRNGLLTDSEYIQKKAGCFQKFINEYRIARNVKKERVKDLMIYAKQWAESENSLNVDNFAIQLKDNNITFDGKVMTSLASKVLFLNSPETIIPLDRYNKKALNHKNNNYTEFRYKVDLFKQQFNNEIITYIRNIEEQLIPIEQNYMDVNLNFESYRTIRFIDKLLWKIGKDKLGK